VVVHKNCHHANIGHESFGSSDYILASQPRLPWSLQAAVIHAVEVALGQELARAVLSFVHFDHSMYNRNVSSIDLKYRDVADAN
jgi:hypothetical protein